MQSLHEIKIKAEREDGCGLSEGDEVVQGDKSHTFVDMLSVNYTFIFNTGKAV